MRSDTIRWGILGTASIAIRRLVPAIHSAPSATLSAIASRDLARARKAAVQAHAPLAYGSYEELLNDRHIDAIYIPLPNHLHVPWSLRSLEAGKHVLCEKPIALNAREAATLQQAMASHPALKFMEAFMYRFHPRWEAVEQMLRRGELGALGTVHTHFSYHNADPHDIRNQADAGGGGLLDIGCYGVNVARWLFAKEPTAVTGVVELDPRFGTDRLASGVLDFGTGTGTFTCATQLPWQQHVTIVGSTARLEVERPFNPEPDSPTTLVMVRESAVEERTFAAADQYAIMVERFSRAIIAGTPVPTALDDAIANMVVLDQVRG